MLIAYFSQCTFNFVKEIPLLLLGVRHFCRITSKKQTNEAMEQINFQNCCSLSFLRWQSMQWKCKLCRKMVIFRIRSFLFHHIFTVQSPTQCNSRSSFPRSIHHLSFPMYYIGISKANDQTLDGFKTDQLNLVVFSAYHSFVEIKKVELIRRHSGIIRHFLWSSYLTMHLNYSMIFFSCSKLFMRFFHASVDFWILEVREEAISRHCFDHHQ